MNAAIIITEPRNSRKTADKGYEMKHLLLPGRPMTTPEAHTHYHPLEKSTPQS